MVPGGQLLLNYNRTHSQHRGDGLSADDHVKFFDFESRRVALTMTSCYRELSSCSVKPIALRVPNAKPMMSRSDSVSPWRFTLGVRAKLTLKAGGSAPHRGDHTAARVARS
ncbi:hypothetical protein ElyMa_005122300 [Elysia marginata]|uniref:Uncharacterized protein n=1 Tax=Elysia marginata TaxID=1093978 RepID=A0AAV4JJL3_9GAST|nr:hypothetical protein ElyMa_005122300 [Elysia marginata]